MRLISFLFSVLAYSSFCQAQTVAQVANVIDGGGSLSSNACFRSHVSVNQPNPAGYSSNGKFLNSAGFLQSDSTVPASSADSDGDGVTDWDELAGTGSDPIAPSNPKSHDSDNDGVSDKDEFAAGTNPNDPLSLFEVAGTQVKGSSIELVWNVRGGRSYSLWTADTLFDLLTNATMIAQSTAIGGDGPWRPTLMIFSNQPTSKHFYRVQTP